MKFWQKIIQSLKNKKYEFSIRNFKQFIIRNYLILKMRGLGKESILNFNELSTTIYVSGEEEARTLDYILDEESEFIARILNELKSEDIVWDVGANIGVHSCLFAEKSNRVISFEPYKPNTTSLRKNVIINNSNVEIHQRCLSNQDGREKISVPESTSSGNQWPALVPEDVSEKRKEDLVNSNIKNVEVRKGDTLVEEGIPQPNVIKIDVEGASLKVIRGMRNILQEEKCRLVYVEVHQPMPDKLRPSVEDFGHNPHEIEDQLREYGFNTTTIIERANDFFIEGRK